MWERFSYYGMRALLVLYMVKYLLLPRHAEHVLGLRALKSGSRSVFGPLDAQPLASQIYGLYTGLVYLTPLFGGLLADRVLGQRRTVVIGAALMAIGHFMMAFEPLFLLALLRSSWATARFKPNISTQVGGLYAPGDRAATAPIPSSMSASISARSWRRWSAARSARTSAGIMASAPPASACCIGLAIYLSGLRSCRPTNCNKGAPRRGPQPLTAPTGAPWSRSWCCSCRRPCSGRPTSSRAIPSCSGPMPIPTARSRCSVCQARFRPRGSRRSTRS